MAKKAQIVEGIEITNGSLGTIIVAEQDNTILVQNVYNDTLLNCVVIEKTAYSELVKLG